MQYSLITARTAYSMRLAWLKFNKTKRVLQASLCPKKKCCHLVCHMSHPWLFSHAPSSVSTSSSSPILPHNEKPQYIPHISKLPRLTSDAIKNHSGVKTCRVTETRAQQLPQVMSQKELATVSRIEAYSGGLYQLYELQEI